MTEPTGSLVRDLPPGDRPRERLRRLGPENLSNVELLAIVLRTGTQGQGALQLAASLLASPGGLRKLVNSPVEELAAVSGVGMAKACSIRAALELGRRLSAETATRPVIKSPRDVSDLLMSDMRYLEKEQFRVLLLNTKNQVLAVEVVSLGDLTSAIVHPREVFKEAVRRAAAAVILVHNHPSGDPSPSREDFDVTKRVTEAGKILGIEVLDHIVIGDNRYISLREHGARTTKER
ncbi:MAG: RadC family protein [Chloroflexota bacterium]